MRLEYFEMVNAVTAYDKKGGTLVSESIVPDESPVFEGHFPGYPLVPGVLLIETMAQASGYLILALNDFATMPFLMAVDKARFRSFVEPAQELTTTAEFVMDGSGYAATKAKITRDNAVICNAELRFRLMEFPDQLTSLLRDRADQIGLTELMSLQGE